MKLPVAILAGGLATRLHPITETIPKALVDVAGKPFILRQLDYLRRQGVGRVVLCVGFLGEQIEAVVGDGSASGLSVSYSQDWPKLMGTGGALKQALPLLDSQFLVLYGDSYLPIDFASVERDFLAQRQACADDGAAQCGQMGQEQRFVSGQRHCGVQQAGTYA